MFVVTTLAKLGAGVLVVVGGGCVTSVALWQTGYIGTNNAEGSSSVGTQSLQASHVQATQSDTSLNSDGFWQPRQDTSQITQPLATQTDNCKILNSTDWTQTTEGLKKTNKDYVVISCENTGSQLKNWTGFFPKEDLSEEDLTADKTLIIRTNTQDVEEIEEENIDAESNFRTTFTSTIFASGSLTGDWGADPENIDNKELTVFQPTADSESDKKFYLIIPKLTGK